MIEIKLDRVRHLRIDTEEVMAAEKLLDMTLPEILNKIKSVSVVRALLWLGLVWEDPKLKIEDLNPFLRGKGFLECLKKVDAAFAEWQGVDDNPSPFPGSPGEGSGPSPESISG